MRNSGRTQLEGQAVMHLDIVTWLRPRTIVCACLLSLLLFSAPLLAAQGSCTISAPPSSLTVQQGTQGPSTITTTISGGFNSAISLSASGAPLGVRVSFNPQTIPAPGAGSSTMT